MNPPSQERFLFGENIKGLSHEGKVTLLNKEKEREINSLSKKERALRFDGFLVTDKKDKILFQDNKRYSQHFFPLSVLDYAKALYSARNEKSQIPILSVDSHDVLKCDFNCQDCLSVSGTGFPLEKFPKNNFELDLETYKGILKSISEYSKSRGFKGVRFEQSGEGNPDFYKYRKEILKFAKELEMQSVYVSTCSQMDQDLKKALVENSSFIRVSFPGIGEDYNGYSNQEFFGYKDSLNKIEELIKERNLNGKDRELMIGARVALRRNHGKSYFDFTQNLKNLGVDSLQIVKTLIPEGKNLENFTLSQEDREDLIRAEDLNESSFNVTIPHDLDYLVYSRNIGDKTTFPKTCFSALFQPVLIGRSLSVCTIDEIMYDPLRKLGTFRNEPGELEMFLYKDNLKRAMEGIPEKCEACPNIYDNTLLSSLEDLFSKHPQKLNFYEIIR